jgi:hypothetical protein
LFVARLSVRIEREHQEQSAGIRESGRLFRNITKSSIVQTLFGSIKSPPTGRSYIGMTVSKESVLYNKQAGGAGGLGEFLNSTDNSVVSSLGNNKQHMILNAKMARPRKRTSP